MVIDNLAIYDVPARNQGETAIYKSMTCWSVLPACGVSVRQLKFGFHSQFIELHFPLVEGSIGSWPRHR